MGGKTRRGARRGSSLRTDPSRWDERGGAGNRSKGSDRKRMERGYTGVLRGGAETPGLNKRAGS